MFEKAHNYSSYFTDIASLVTDEYLEEKLRSAAGQKNFRYLLNEMSNVLKTSPENIKEEQFEYFFSYLAIEKQNRKDTIHTKYRMLLSYYRFLESRSEFYHLRRSYMPLFSSIFLPETDMQVKDKNVVPPAVVKKLMKRLEEEEQWKLRLAVELSVCYGITLSRMLTLNVEDLYQNNKGVFYLRIQEKPTRLKKNIGLLETTVELFVKACRCPAGPVFYSEKTGEVLSIRWMQQQISIVGKEFVDFPVTFNKLRNTCIVYLLYEGATADEIELMTSSPASMLFRYRNYTGQLADAALKYRSMEKE